ncbi:NAD-dependent epimerase/dehydratase family protein [Marinihelvus fidelis]|uniref:NAD-dependent epimerase/dehydratase family protein n=1 Tax=Marinihelvus fidelis TaxID=2613842 RepID=A0A5N0TC84_9GAMM|nr:NAD-dependent epimerase/dehydratase family protein [Marinihelvus fidelis]KAA9130939.1 NAD-dependent epimerase/dehydratase family protein [Marinihelvus fidelis]
MRQHAFLTGGTGFVGGHLAHELLAGGWTVTVLVRDPDTRAARQLAAQGAGLHTGDVTDPASLLAGMKPGTTAVFHAAADTSVWSRHDARQTRVNVEGTRNVVEAAICAHVKRLVHTSSFSAWGFVHGVLDETTPRSDAGTWINYIRSKRAAEDIVLGAVGHDRLDAVVCNPAHILGPGDRHNWSRMIRMVSDGSLPGVPPGGGAFADVREVARAHVTAFDRGRRGHRYLLGGEDLAFIDLVREVGRRLGRDVPRRPKPAWLLKAVARARVLGAAFGDQAPDLTPQAAAMICHHATCDSSLAQSELNYRFTPIDTLLGDTIAWMRREGMLT